MTTAPVIGPAARWRRAGRDEWDALGSRTQTRLKLALLLLVTVAAYHYSLASLLETVTSDTPLAYLGTVPFFAAGLAWMHRMPRHAEPPIHDRQLDYSIGLPLVGVAVLASLVLPERLGAMAWIDRVDLLFLPVFVAGATVLLFGVRVAWRQKFALLYLFLVWPWPYTRILLGTFGGLRNLTLRALTFLLGVFPVAKPVGLAGETGLFSIVHDGHPFSVSLVTACSGVDSVVGFLLVGVAMAAVVRGRPLRKALWLATGAVVLWSLNLVRLVGIFWVGGLAGRDFALDGLHPVAGLVLFVIGIALLTLLLRPFGLTLVAPARPRRGERRAADTRRRPETSVFLVGAVVLTAAVLVASGNARLRQFDPVASASGEPRLSSYLVRPAAPEGWNPTFAAEYTKSAQLFGGSSRWFRYLYVPDGSVQTGMSSSLPVTADVVDAGNLDGFDDYGVTACYSFHGYDLRDATSVDLGRGVTGQTLSFSGGATKDWSIVYWIWPVRTGDGTRYERVILYLQNTRHDQVVPAQGIATVARTLDRGADALTKRLAVNRAFLVDFARSIVTGQSTHRDFDVRVADLEAPGATRDRWLAGTRSSDGTTRTSPSDGVDEVQARFWADYAAKHPSATQAAAASGGEPS